MISTLVTLVVLVGQQFAPAEAHQIKEYPIDGVDVASWQHPGGKAINWQEVKASGVEFATIKATEGSPADNTDYVNPWFTPDLDGARAAGMPVAPYHFYLGRTEDTGADQAEHFISTLRQAGYTGHRPLDLPPILDFEWDWKTSKCPTHVTVDDAQAWLDEVEEAFDRQPIIYTNRYFITNCLGDSPELGGYPLQVAHYAPTPPETLPAGWSSWLMWQWTSRGRVPGIASPQVTRSVFNGTRADLDALAGISVTSGSPSPSASPPAVSTLSSSSPARQP